MLNIDRPNSVAILVRFLDGTGHGVIVEDINGVCLYDLDGRILDHRPMQDADERDTPANVLAKFRANWTTEPPTKLTAREKQWTTSTN